MRDSLRPHRVWLGILLLAVTIIGVSRPTVATLQVREQERLDRLQGEQTRLAATIRQVRADMAETERLNAQIGTTEADRLLAPADRLRAAHALESKAAAFRLSDVTYSFAPEQSVTLPSASAGPQVLARSRVTVKAVAPADTDAYGFLDALRHSLPGRFDLRAVSLERIGSSGADIKPANIRVSAEGDWLSNGAAQNLAASANGIQP